jgi:hypothetical protein
MTDKLAEVRRVAEAELADMPNREFVPTKTGDYVDAGRWSVARQIIQVLDRPDERGDGEPLAVKIVDGKLVIEIGVDTLRFCAEMQACRFDDALNGYVYPLKVTDRNEYARDVVRALNDEREDGSTILTDLLDKAFMSAWEDGSTGCAEEGYGTQQPSPVPPPAPTTGDEGKENQ